MESQSKETSVRAVCIERCKHGSEGGVAQSRPDSTLLPYINTCNLDELAAQGFSPEAILRDGCVNAHAAAWILRREYERTGNIWTAIGAYHSRTPSLRDAYAARVKKHLARMARMGSGLWPDGVLP
jgi:hypothetical protein